MVYVITLFLVEITFAPPVPSSGHSLVRNDTLRDHRPSTISVVERIPHLGVDKIALQPGAVGHAQSADDSVHFRLDGLPSVHHCDRLRLHVRSNHREKISGFQFDLSRNRLPVLKLAESSKLETPALSRSPNPNANPYASLKSRNFVHYWPFCSSDHSSHQARSHVTELWRLSASGNRVRVMHVKI